MKLKISFPQIYIESKTIEVPDEQGEEILNSCNDETANFIFDNLTELEQNCTYGVEMLRGAISSGYCAVKKS